MGTKEGKESNDSALSLQMLGTGSARLSWMCNFHAVKLSIMPVSLTFLKIGQTDTCLFILILCCQKQTLNICFRS